MGFTSLGFVSRLPIVIGFVLIKLFDKFKLHFEGILRRMFIPPVSYHCIEGISFMHGKRSGQFKKGRQELFLFFTPLIVFSKTYLYIKIFWYSIGHRFDIP